MIAPATPQITLIIACKNAVEAATCCLNNLAQQTVLPHQIILKDALSCDGIDLLPKQYPQLPITLLSCADSGICDAWNQALDVATGEWILFLGADDILHAPDVLMKAHAHLMYVPKDVAIAYGQVLMVDEKKCPIELLGSPWEKACQGIKLWGGNFLPHQGVFHRRAAFHRFGKFDTSFRIAGDYEFLRRILPQNPAVYLPSFIVTSMQDGGLSGQPKLVMQAAKEICRAIRMHGKLQWQTRALVLACSGVYILGMLIGQTRTIRLRQQIKRSVNRFS